MDKDGIIETVDELAKHVGSTKRTIFRWIAAGMPRLPDGRFDALAVAEWRRRKKGSAPASQVVQASTPGETEAPEKAQASLEGKDLWDAESKKWQALTRKNEFLKDQRQLIEVSKVEKLIVAKILAAKSSLSTLKVVLPPDLIVCQSEMEMAQIIDKVVTSILKEFSRPIPLRPRPDGDAPND